MAAKRTLVRGGITLAVLAALAGAMVVAPAGAHVTSKFGHLKKHINQIAKKQANQVFNQNIGGAIAGKQDKCADGAVIAYALINVDTVATDTFGTTGVSPQFNCAGGPVEARYNSGTAHFDVRIPGVTTGAGGSSGVVANLEFVNIDCDIGFAVCTAGSQVFASSYGTDAGQDFMAVLIQYEDDTNTVTTYDKGECAGFFFGGQCALAVAVYNK